MPTALVSSGAWPIPAGSTTTQTSPDFRNGNASGVKVVVVTTAIGTGSVTLSIQARDPGSGSYYTLLTGLPIVSNTTMIYTLAPAVAVVANASARDVLPGTWRLVLTWNNPSPVTCSVGFTMVP